MFSSNPPGGRRPGVNSIRRPKGPRALTLLFVIHPTLFGFGAFCKEQPIKAAYRKHPYKPPGSTATASALPSPQQTENIFIDALAQAALCHTHVRPRRNIHLSSHTGYTYHKARRRNILSIGRQTRFMHHATTIRPATMRTSPSREEYLNLVDTYRELYSTQAQWMEPTPLPPLPILFSPKPENVMPSPPLMRAPSPMNDMTLIPLAPVTIPSPILVGLSPNQPTVIVEAQPKFSEPISPPRIDYQRPDVEHLLRVLEKPDCIHDDAYKAYSALPAPGVSHLSKPQIRLLLRRLSTMEKKDRVSALRYLSVVDDMNALELPLVESEWNSAIAFCGQCLSHVRSGNVENAVLTWKEMEHSANIKSSMVTFNILFDMAAKAGKFKLAEMIIQEMENRGLEYNRYFRVGNIYFHGLKGDGDGVRRAYRDLVDAGEIVDTIVINCVIAALISAGELASAENVYDRMKRMLSTHTGLHLPPTHRTWRETRNMGRIFDRLARNSRKGEHSTKDVARLNFLKAQVSIMPNIQTYAIFIEHHAWRTGDLHRISALLNDMQELGMAIQGRIFLKLFKGFANHGRGPYTDWTPQRLKSVWNSLLEVLDDDEAADVRIGKWMIIWAVRAFDTCAGRQWALHIWEELKGRWKPEKGELEMVCDRLRDILKIDRKNSWKDGEIV